MTMSACVSPLPGLSTNNICQEPTQSLIVILVASRNLEAVLVKAKFMGSLEHLFLIG